ncbi:helix-turn-helix domain-containing protein [Nocardia mexicana]|uniref:Helix-turn-helix protein n=1 Tax=Nocardia mexicana TaxID=279262 RepID=A0A370GV55_9NOCA|nr:helix-turn-helix transcriptional regulator [Nocardia mexicana]RDI46454.1 helix-turn-helix protein [Nocardia mexicana]
MTARADRDSSAATAQASADRGPTVLRIALGGQLRKLREEREVSRQTAGEALRASETKITRLELGQTGFKERDLSDLLTLYGVNDADERDRLLTLARQANRPGWWHRYSDLLPSWFETYVGLEQAALGIRIYETHYIPGLFQTADYARYIFGLDSRADAQRLVDMRMRRQRILTRTPTPPTVWAVIDEHVLRRQPPDRQVARDQLRHLLDLAQRPNITVQVLPEAAGPTPAEGGSFSMLRFPEEELPDVVYLEQLTGALYLDKNADLQRYRKLMDTLCAGFALSPEQTPIILHDLLDGLT